MEVSSAVARKILFGRGISDHESHDAIRRSTLIDVTTAKLGFVRSSVETGNSAKVEVEEEVEEEG